MIDNSYNKKSFFRSKGVYLLAALCILAAGAGAISKRLFKGENRIERLADVKDVKGYIERADGMRERHENFWKKR